MAALMLASCEKVFYTSSKWKAINFTASRADVTWASGDNVRIYCPEGSIYRDSVKWADYRAVPSGSTVSFAPMTEGVELRWGDAIHHFYAVRPAVEMSGNVIEGEIPGIQDTKEKMFLTEVSSHIFEPDLSSIGYMAATAEAIRSEQAVDLQFKPLYTTIQFVVSAGADADALVSGFRLVSDGGALAGGFSATLSEGADPAVSTATSDTSSEVKVNLGVTGSVTVLKGETLVITVIALPRDLSNLKAIFTVDGEERVMPLVDANGVPLVIPACRKTSVTALDFLAPEQEGFFKISIESQDVDEYDLSY